MGVTALPFTAIVNVPSGRLLGNNGVSTGQAVALTNTQVFAVLATGTPSATTYLRGDGTWSTVSAGVGGSTGSTDNAVLRADGTGGATLQNASFVIPDNVTASPNATVNHASIQATGGTTNVSVSIVPKGTGAFSLHVPDGTATGGNARGANSVDLQTTRTAAAQVASAPNSIIAGSGNTASGSGGHAVFGVSNSSTNAWSLVAGTNNSVTGYSTLCTGSYSTVSGNDAGSVGFSNSVAASFSFGVGRGVTTRLGGEFAHGNNNFATAGDCQRVALVIRGKTTNATPTELTSETRCTIPAGFVFHAIVKVTGSKSDGSAIAAYLRQVVIKRVGNTTTLQQSVTVGTDYEDNASTDVTITADDTNESLKIEVTGIASETWRWQAVIEGGLHAYGT